MGVVAVVALVVGLALGASLASLRFRPGAVKRDGTLTATWNGFVLAVMVTGGLALLAMGIYHIADGTYRSMALALRIGFGLSAISAAFLVVGVIGVYVLTGIIEPLDEWAYQKTEPVRRYLRERRDRRHHIRERSRRAAMEARRAAAEEGDERPKL